MSSDLDFNELDKAVNSLTGSQGAKPSASSALPADKKETSSPLKPHAGRGKFMDVVHPASDMTTVTPPTAAPADGDDAPSIGKTITPASKDIKPDPAPEKDVDKLPVVKQLSKIDDADPKSLVATPDIAETAKPDPLEEAAKKERERVARDGAKQRKAQHKTEKSEPENEVTEKPEEKPGAKEKDSKEKPEVKPLFLEDAKVEKRPLGAFNDEKQKEPETDSPALKTKGDAQKESSPLPPPEFDEKVVALEASDEAGAKDETSPKLPVQEKKPEKSPEKFSIPSQYNQAKKPEDAAAQNSIYESASFNAFADSNTPSNTKPWMWVIIFLGIIALGVALSLGTFFVVGTN